MLRQFSILLAGAALLAFCASCGDDDTTGQGGSTATGTTSTGTAAGGTGGTGGGGGTGGTGGTAGGGGTGGTMPVNNCEPSVVSEETCPQEGMVCTKPTGCCDCQGIVGCGTEPIWICVEPPGDTECPPTPPTYNAACTTEGALCEYCVGSAGIELWRCYNGLWLERMPGCTGPG